MSEVYFGVKKTKKFFLDTEKTQWVEFKRLNEGERINFQDSVSGTIRVDQITKKAEMESKIGSDRAALINLAVCGFNVLVGDEGKVVNEYSKEKWEELYREMDGAMAEKLYEEILEFNGFGPKKN